MLLRSGSTAAHLMFKDVCLLEGCAGLVRTLLVQLQCLKHAGMVAIYSWSSLQARILQADEHIRFGTCVAPFPIISLHAARADYCSPPRIPIKAY